MLLSERDNGLAAQVLWTISLIGNDSIAANEQERNSFHGSTDDKEATILFLAEVVGDLRADFFHDVAGNVRQSEIAAAEPVSEFLMIDAHQIEDGGV